MLRCANCGHLYSVHTHYRRGTDCADEQNGRCLCARWANPFVGWLWDRWEQAAEWLARRG